MADTADRASPPPDDAAALRYLERFLVGDEGAGFDLHALEARGLAAFAYGRAQAASGDGAPVGATEARLRMAYVMARARHAIVRKATRDLLAAWHDAGIETLITKGFALAEYVYPDPAWRFYSDVDVAIAPVHLERAAQLAPDHGWNVVWRAGAEVGVNSRRGGAYQGHELLTLFHPATDVNMDVHRRLVHNNDNRLARWAKQEAITRAAWRASRPNRLDGVPVRLLDPRDAALIGLVLNRSWSSDAFALRVHDYLDLRFLAERAGVTRAVLEERASELGCERTLALFLERCDPYRRHLDLTPPNRNQRLRWDAVLASERGHRGAERLVLDLTRAPAQALDVLRELPHVAGRVWRRRGGTPGGGGPEAGGAARLSTLDRETWRRVQRGVRRALRICGVSPQARPDLALACAADALRRRGLPADVERRPEGAVLVVGGAVLDVSGLGIEPKPEP